MAALRVCLIILLLVQSRGVAAAAELSFFCPDALAPSMRELVPVFEKRTEHQVRMTIANAGTIAARLQSGERVDFAIVLPPAWDRLRQQGRIDPAVRIVLGKVGLGAFVKRGNNKPDISTVDAFKRAIMSARKLAVRDPAQGSPVGTYMLALFDRLDLSEAVRSKLVLTRYPPYEEVRNGEAELGFSTLAEIAAEPGAELVGPLPSDIQTYNIFTAAISTATEQQTAAGEFLRFLTSDSAKAALRSKGIDTD